MHLQSEMHLVFAVRARGICYFPGEWLTDTRPTLPAYTLPCLGSSPFTIAIRLRNAVLIWQAMRESVYYIPAREQPAWHACFFTDMFGMCLSIGRKVDFFADSRGSFDCTRTTFVPRMIACSRCCCRYYCPVLVKHRR